MHPAPGSDTAAAHETRYRVLFQSIRDGILIVDNSGHYVDVNESFCRILSAPRERLLGAHFSEFIPPSHLNEAIDAFSDLQSGRPTPVDFPLQRVDGTIVELEWTSTTNYLPGFHFCVCRDVTERRSVERALRAREEESRALLAALPDVIVRFDRDLRFIYISAAVERVAGLPPEHFIGKTHEEAGMPPRLANHLRASLTRIFETGLPDTVEFDFDTVSNGVRHLVGIGVPELGPNGGVVTALSIVRDITDQKRAERALRESEERLRSLVQATATLIWTTSAEGQFVSPQPAWERYTGQRWPEYANWGGMQVVYPDDLERVGSTWKHAMQTRTLFEIESRLWHAPSEQWRHTICRAVPILESDGSVREWVGCHEDIHERKLAEEALRQSLSALKRANEDLEQFAYAAAHDLQEPIRNIALYTQLLSKKYRGQFDEQATMFLDTTVEGAQRLHLLVQDLLAYTRAVERGSHRRGRCDANEVIAGVIRNLGTYAEETNTKILYGSLPHVGIPAVQLTQVLQNLIGNSIKYRNAEPPLIEISAERDGAFWKFIVRDNGVGVPLEHHGRVFKVFKRLHSRSIPGTGIGLAICERIVTHHGGEIRVESDPAGGTKGAAFIFTVPAAGEPDAANS